MLPFQVTNVFLSYIYILFYTYMYILFHTCIYFLFYTYSYIFITEIAGNDFFPHASHRHRMDC